VKERYHASAQLSNECEHVFAPKKDTSTTIAGSEEDKKQQTLLKKKRKREEKKFRSFSKLSYFLLFCTHSVALSFVLFFLNRSGGNFSAPPRDDSETFKTSVAGQSNWNAYEGSGEKELTPEEKKAKAKAEEDASNARRAAAAAKMQAEREKAGYKGSIF
jgi:cytoskeletal protein RodZ